jgi:hypothetical protein
MGGSTAGWAAAAGIVLGSVGLALLAALGGPALERRRSRTPQAHSETTYGDWDVGDPRLAAHVFTALSQLQRGLAARNLPAPDLAAVLTGYDRIILRLTRPAPVSPFPPWRLEVGDHTGRSWVVDTADLHEWEPGPIPYPMLTAVGRHGGWTLLVDLAQPSRRIALAGDDRRVGHVLADLAYGLSSNPWSRDVRIVCGGGPDELAVPEPGRVAHFRSVADSLAYAGQLADDPVAGPLALLLAEPPATGEAPALDRLAADRRRAVVVAGPPEPAPAGTGGELSLGPVWPVRDDAGPPNNDAAEVEVGVLGPLYVRAPGDVPGRHGPTLAAVVAMAAVLPAGVPAAVVAEVLLDSAAAPDAARQLHDWLGADQRTGLPHLCERDGRWRLSADTQVDCRRFQQLASDAESPGERARLATALAMIRGELLAGVRLGPATAQTLHHQLAALTEVAERAARRYAAVAVEADDPVRAEWALRQALMLLPKREALWRALLEFQLEHRRQAVERTARELVTALAGRRRLEPATRKLLSRLRRAELSHDH